MRCDEARKKLNDAFDRGLSITDDVPLMTHVRRCKECAAVAEPLLSFRDDLAVASADDMDGGQSFDSLRRQVESEASRRPARQPKETSIMARILSNMNRPRVGIGVAAVAAILLLALLIPFKVQDNTVGYEVAFAGVDRGIAMDTEKIDDFLATLGMEGAQVDVGDCEQTCKLKITHLKSADDAYLVYTAFNDFVTVELTADVMELQRGEDGSVAQFNVQLKHLEEDAHLDKETAHRIVVERAGKDFTADHMIWVAVDSVGETAEINLNGKVYTFDGDDLSEQDIRELKDAGINVTQLDNEDGKAMLFLSLGDSGKAFVHEHGDEAAEKTEGSLPDGFELHQNYPNPFNPNTTIAFSIPEASRVTLEIFNVNGQKVTTLVDDYLDSGRHTVDWNATDQSGRSVASGVYLYRLTAGDVVSTKKMSLVK